MMRHIYFIIIAIGGIAGLSAIILFLISEQGQFTTASPHIELNPHGPLTGLDAKVASNLMLRPNESYSFDVDVPDGKIWAAWIFPEDVLTDSPTLLQYRVNGNNVTEPYIHANGRYASYAEMINLGGDLVMGKNSITITNTGTGTMTIRELWIRVFVL